MSNKQKISENNKRIQQLTESLFKRIVADEEKRCGHAFSGGRGASCFLKLHTDVGVFRSYGNGIVENELAAKLRETIPGYIALESNLD